MTLSTETVSYTHLDVYKRQIMDTVTDRLEINIGRDSSSEDDLSDSDSNDDTSDGNIIGVEELT